jgi:hypothetical protein
MSTVQPTSGLVEVQPEHWGFLGSLALTWISMEHVCQALGTDHAVSFLASRP